MEVVLRCLGKPACYSRLRDFEARPGGGVGWLGAWGRLATLLPGPDRPSPAYPGPQNREAMAPA